MNKKHFYTAVILLLFLAAGIKPVNALHNIPSDTTIGTWDSFERTYTITKDVNDTIQIDEHSLTLDGAGHTVDGTGSGYGVYVLYKSFVTIMNLNVQNFDTGIHIQYSDNITLTGNNVSDCNAGDFSSGIYLNYTKEIDLTNNTVSNNSYGIRLYVTYSNLDPDQGNTLTNNTVLDNTYGIELSSTYYNTLTSNTVSGNDEGIRIYGFGPPDTPGNTLTNNNASNNDFGITLHTAKSNTLTDNSVVSNTIGGIYLTNSDDNTIYNNSFIDNTTQASVDGGGINVFYLPYPTGGNYWSDYTGVDNDANGFGDDPYTFNGGQDKLPIFSPKLAIIQLIDMVEALNAKEGIINSLDAKLQNALDALDAANAGQRQDAINKMEAFINSVEAQSDNQISVDDANALIAFAEYIIGML